jgi:hypothetical protein
LSGKHEYFENTLITFNTTRSFLSSNKLINRDAAFSLTRIFLASTRIDILIKAPAAADRTSDLLSDKAAIRFWMVLPLQAAFLASSKKLQLAKICTKEP